MIPPEEFNKSFQEFQTDEGKLGTLYPMFIDLVKNNKEIEACLFIIMTWNAPAFRRVVREFNINEFKNKMNTLNTYFDNFKDENFKSINFDTYENQIDEIFTTLSDIKGIKYTGASKIMHLKKPAVFVMWDSYISGQKPKKYYENLDIVKKGYYNYKKYHLNSKGYFEFLKDMQDRFGHIDFDDKNVPFTRAIDAFNFWNITKPIQESELLYKKSRK